MDKEPDSGFLGLGKVAAYFDSVGKIVAAIAGVVALITGIVSLVFLLSPDPPATTKAALSDLRFVGQVTLAEYLLETGRNPQDYRPDEREQVGNYYQVRVTTEGLRKRNPAIFWSVRSLGQVSIPSPEQWIHQLLDRFRPPADTYSYTARIWIQSPPVPGKFYAEIAVDYPEYASLAVTTTPAFSGKRSQPRATHPVTVEKTITTVVTVPESTTTMVTTVAETTSTGTTMVPTTVETTIPPTTTAITTKTTETVASPVPLPRPTVKLKQVTP